MALSSKSAQLVVVMDRQQLARFERYRVALAKRSGLAVSRSALARLLIKEALEAREEKGDR